MLPAYTKGLLPSRYEPAMVATDARVTEQLQEAGYEVRSYSGLLLREPSEVRLEMGTGRWVGHFGTLSPFLRCDASLPLSALFMHEMTHNSADLMPGSLGRSAQRRSAGIASCSSLKYDHAMRMLIPNHLLLWA